MMKNRSEIEVKGSVTNVEFFIPNSIPYIKIYLIHTHTHTHTHKAIDCQRTRNIFKMEKKKTTTSQPKNLKYLTSKIKRIVVIE